MPSPFTLRVPADAQFRVLAPQIAGKYLELVGGSTEGGAELAAAIAKAMDALGDSEAADFDLSFSAHGGAVEATVRCAGRSTVVRHALSDATL
jgi:hypothetical protein